MITHERIARDLAAVLSPGGEADWRQYLALARAVAKSLDQQFEEVFHFQPESSSERRSAGGPAQQSGYIVPTRKS